MHREKMRRVDSMLLPIITQRSHEAYDIVDIVRKLIDELEEYREKLETMNSQPNNIRALCLEESMKTFEDSKRTTELQRYDESIYAQECIKRIPD